MERVVLQQFRQWKERPDRKPLIVNGARQVGKTWILREFGKREYAKCAYFVCRKNQQLTKLFSEDFDIDRILPRLRALSGVDISPHNTLIIFDEVQDTPAAIESLKYFCEKAPDYHIAVAGSLLGVSLHSNVSFPVGKVNSIDVYPLNFEEFLHACGDVDLCKYLREQDYDMLNFLHDKYVNRLREYYFVGGMPEAVSQYIKDGALGQVRRIQNEILKGYELDFSKHAPNDQVQRIRLVWQTVASQLFKENKKFIYGSLRKGARAKDFEIAIEWLTNSGIVTKVPLVNKVALPLKIYEDPAAFKLYTLDIGLLGAMVNTDPAQVLMHTNVFSEYKGGMTEQYVMQQMLSCGENNIYYHKSEDSRLEIDFVIQRNGELIPIEVKAEKNVRANSLSRLLAADKSLHAVRYSMQKYTHIDNLECVPLYAAR